MPRLPARGGVIMPTERWKAWTCRITLRRRSTGNLRIYRPGRTGQDGTETGTTRLLRPTGSQARFGNDASPKLAEQRAQ
ncbi:unnamed protein product [Strongylus vulgaris]|uniref:Uncharacterized protein n=1 Tax=Strongylus vulgaris TaxID=40348 RepID=A0A3P7JH06_STRVU|nr:unnamed protein product [Strongylus vulgaris]